MIGLQKLVNKMLSSSSEKQKDKERRKRKKDHKLFDFLYID
jgi:hypothetical protein